MKKQNLINLCFMALFVVLGIFVSCYGSSRNRVLHSVPLCDCDAGREGTRDNYHHKYVCDTHTQCVSNNGQTNKLVRK